MTDADHDLLIRIDTKLDIYVAQQEKNTNELWVAVDDLRKDVRELSDQFLVSQGDTKTNTAMIGVIKSILKFLPFVLIGGAAGNTFDLPMP